VGPGKVWVEIKKKLGPRGKEGAQSRKKGQKPGDAEGISVTISFKE